MWNPQGYVRVMRQSTYNSYLAYQLGDLCGLQLEAQLTGQWVDEQSEAQAAGWWFEDMVVRGTTDRPMGTLRNGEPNALYRQLWRHLEVARRMFDSLPKPLTSNMRLELDGIEGTPDIVTMDGRVIDFKTTAHLSNRWDSYGWGALFANEPNDRAYNAQLQQRLVQAAAYCHLSKALAPIYEPASVCEFWVFSTTSDDARVLRLELSDDTLADVVRRMREAQADLEAEMVYGLEPRPELTRCRNCQLRDKCSHAAQVPTAKVIKC